MTIRSWMQRVFPATRPNGSDPASESDVPDDPGLASSRSTGGLHSELSGDRGSVTGTGETGEFVGQVAGDDLGYAGETGAERRAEAGERTAGDQADDRRR